MIRFLAGMLAATALPAAAPQDTAVPDMDEILTAASVGAPALAPDGSRIAYTLGGEIHVVGSNGSGDRVVARGSAPAWPPDGETLAFISSRGDSRQVWTVPAGGGEAEPLTDLDQFVDRFQWSPDGVTIAVLARPAHQADLRFLVRHQKPGEPTVVDVNNLPRNRLWVVDVQTRQARPITSEEFSVGGYEQWFPDGFSWSPDSRRIAFSQRPHAKAGSHLVSEVAIVDVSSGKTRTLTDREGMNGYPQFSPDGRSIAFIATDKRDWVTTSWLYRVDVATGRVEGLTPEFDEKIREFFWADGGRRILFLAGEGVSMQLYAVDVTARKTAKWTSGVDFRSGLEVSRDGGSLAYVQQNFSEPPAIWFSAVADFRPQRVTAPSAQRAAWPVIETEILQWKSFDGLEIEGLFHKPLDYQEGRPYPLLVIPHGGPHGVDSNRFVDGEVRIFAQRGWGVFRPNFRGSGHYGQRFLRANLHGWGIGDYADVMSGVDLLIERGDTDPERLAMTGSSYGGYMSSWTITQTDRFKAAVIGAPITDLPSFMRTTDVPDRFEDYLGTDPLNYLRSSPMHYADNIRTPTLVWHGEEDLRVPLMQGRHLYTALLKNGVPAEFVIYHGEPHGLTDLRHQRDLIERKVQWLERWTMGGK